MCDYKTGGYKVRIARSFFLDFVIPDHSSHLRTTFLQERRTSDYFYILERSYSSVDDQPPLYVAHAPEFSTASKFQPVVATGSSEREALHRLKCNIKVRQFGAVCLYAT